MPEESLFDLLLNVTPADRAAILDRETADRPEVRDRLVVLLAAADRRSAADATKSIADPAATKGLPEAADTAAADHESGTVIAGKYTLVELIGEGGMGTVWRAKQTEPVKRFVAVKLIKAGMDSKQVLARFEAERQALALMDHPNIARVYDGGIIDKAHGRPTVGSGSPYFVMELVKGVPITDYCDAHKLPPKARLELFVQACQAIQHAHQKGIIHRDIKPSNVLVAMYDDRPVVKVIDFGVAKATGGTLTEATIDTGFGGIVGTPQYMSPEQATFNNLDIDTRSDVYALGVLLYELLAGSPPFSGEELKKRGLLEMLRVVREEEPPRPSTKLSTADALPSLSANRGTEPKKLTGLLRNELDWIVMKSLEKDRTRRYETANGFAADVNRYLSGDPVLAHPPSAGYRLKKLMRRNKGPVVAAGTVAAALLVGLAAFAWQARVAQQERDVAKVERENAVAERTKADAAKVEAQAKEAEANAVVAFFENKVFAAAGPKGQAGGLGKEVSLRDAIVASLPALGQGFATQPLVEARLRHALGTTFYYLAEYEQARDQCERSRALFSRHRGPDHPDTLSSMNNLANSYAALNRPAEALKLLEELLEIQKRVLPKDHPDTLGIMSNLANRYVALNRPAEALKLREDVLAIQKRVLPQDHPNTLTSMHNLGNSYAALNRQAEALKLDEEVLAIRKRVLPQDHPDTLVSMNNLANRYAALNRPAEALTLREEVLAIRKRVLPKDHPHTLTSMNNLATSYAALNRPAEALTLREEVLAIQRRVLPKDDPGTLTSMHNLATSYSALNRPAEALKLLEELLEIQKRVLPKDHPDTLRSMWGMADSLIKLDRGAEAIPLIDECVAKAAGQAVPPGMIPSVMSRRVRHFQKVGDPAGCRTTAEMWEKLNRPDADSLYNAACFRSVTAGVQAKTPEGMTPRADAARFAKEDADRAMEWLQKAVQAGYKDVAHLKKDADLDPLRGREDFKTLLAELKKKAEKK